MALHISACLYSVFRVVGFRVLPAFALAGMADDAHVHVTQALKGSLSDVKPEPDPHATPPHRYTPTSDEDALTPPYPPPEDGLDSIQLEDDLSFPGMQGVKAEHSTQLTH